MEHKEKKNGMSITSNAAFKEQTYRFKVNLGGMIEILSDHLYSGPDVYIRELLQNGVDAISARKRKDSSFSVGSIHICITEGRELCFIDNGSGLTEEEVHRFLAIIGESSKKELMDSALRNDYIGRFGIGLLSCFMVSEEIKLRTRSMEDSEGKTLEWIGKPDGTYTLQIVDVPMEVGTAIYLTAKEDMEEYFTWECIEELIVYYGMLLPVPILLETKEQKQQINPVFLPWDNYKPSKEELLLFGKRVFQENNFLDCFLLKSKEGEVEGVAYVLPYALSTVAKHVHRIYLKNMLLTEKGDDLIPEWAVFFKCIINAKELRPTASRESFYQDMTLISAKANLERQMLSYVLELAQSKSQMFQNFFQINQLTLRALALEYENLCEHLIDFFTFHTTKGELTGKELKEMGEPLYYTTVEQNYKRLAQFFITKNKLLIAAYFAYDVGLLQALAEMTDLSMEEVSDEILEEFMQDVSVSIRNESFDFLETANGVLQNYNCRSDIKRFFPTGMPVFYSMDELTQVKRKFTKAKEAGGDNFFELLSAFEEESGEMAEDVLYFNYENPLVKKMISSKDGNVQSFIELLYIQALLTGGFHLRAGEMYAFNQNILQLMDQVLL